MSAGFIKREQFFFLDENSISIYYNCFFDNRDLNFRTYLVSFYKKKILIYNTRKICHKKHIIDIKTD